MVLKRSGIWICNLIFPPLAVFLLCGAGEDLFINSMLFILAVFPSHIHSWYISTVYFNRKRKVRKGRYPGNIRPMIYCEKVQNGGASPSELRRFKNERDRQRREKEAKKQEGGRLRRLARRMMHRHQPDTGAELQGDYYDQTPQRQMSQMQNSRIGDEMPGPSRHSTRRRRSSHVPDAGEYSQLPDRRTSVRNEVATYHRRSQITSPTEGADFLRRHDSIHSSYEPIEAAQINDSPGNQRLSRRQTTRSASNGRSVRRDSETLSEFAARPMLPPRPGMSYRDDINRWVQNMPIEAH
jgi:uncharacterized membrane protein YqaE (UPF0057 family)